MFAVLLFWNSRVLIPQIMNKCKQRLWQYDLGSFKEIRESKNSLLGVERRSNLLQLLLPDCYDGSMVNNNVEHMSHLSSHLWVEPGEELLALRLVHVVADHVRLHLQHVHHWILLNEICCLPFKFSVLNFFLFVNIQNRKNNHLK